MSKKTKAVATETPKRSAGRPSTFPEGTEISAFPSRVSVETITRLREMKDGRQSPFGLTHNSIGAELHRIVEQAYKRFESDRDRAAKRTTKRKPVEAAPVEAPVEN